MDDRAEESIGEMPTLGHEEPVRAMHSPGWNQDESIGELTTLGPGRIADKGRKDPVRAQREPAWNSDESIGELTTLKAGGIVDDGRTDGARRWKAGEEILGRYVVERELGQGGMGVVYGCFDKVGGVKVAVKCLPPELSHNSVEMEEVRENFQLVVGLRHPNIAGVRTLEKDNRGEYFLVMDLAEGESLRAWLRRKWKAGGVTLAEAVGILRQVASALDYAHGEKVVHRDVKPGNVMIDGRGRVKVLDFGLAAQIRTSMSRASHAYRGTSGTGPYMAPEQWRGRPQDGKTDQYALGVMAYEMLAGHLPFENDEVSVLREVVLKEEPEDIPGVLEGAMAAIRRAMAKSAAARFPACGAFAEALDSAASQGRASTPCEPGKGPAAGRSAGKPAGTPARSASSPYHRSGARWVAALVLATAVGAGVWGWRESGRGGGWLERLWGGGNAGEETARPENSPHRTAEEEEAEKRAEEELLAAKRQAEEERLAAEKAEEEKRQAEEEAAKRLEEERTKELEETVYRLAAETRTKAEAIAGYDRGQGFGERLDVAKSKLLQGEAAIQGRNFGKAKEWLEESLAATKWLEENAPQREEAARARDAAAMAKGRADAMDGGRLNVPSYQQGNEWETDAGKAFERAQFKEAAVTWTEAGDAYAAAATEARSKKVRQGLDAARRAKRLASWDEVITAVEEVLALDAGNEEAKQLKEEAEKLMRSPILQKPPLNGRNAVPMATERVVGKTDQDPFSVELVAEKPYVLMPDGRRIEGTAIRATDSGEIRLVTPQGIRSFPKGRYAKAVAKEPEEYRQAIAAAQAKQYPLAEKLLGDIIAKYQGLSWDEEAAKLLNHIKVVQGDSASTGALEKRPIADLETKRSMEVRRAQMLVEAAEQRSGDERNKLLDEAEIICNDLGFGGLDIAFVNSVVVLANVELARGNRAKAANILAKNMDIIKPIDDSLAEMGLSMKDSPMAGARSLRGRLLKEDADAIANTPSKTDEAIKLYAQALTEYYNVFAKYGDSPWGPTAGTVASEIKGILEDKFGKRVTINLPANEPCTEFALADDLFRQQKYDEAASEYRRGLERFPDEGDVSAGALAQLLQCYLNLNRTEDAKNVANSLGLRFAKKSAIPAKALLSAGALYDKKKDEATSKYIFGLYLKYCPDDAQADKILFWLASKAEAAGNMDEANSYLAKIITDYPNGQYYPQALSKRAWKAYADQDYEASIDGMKLYIATASPSPNRAQAMFALGSSYQALGRMSDAVQQFSDLVDALTPENNPYGNTLADRERNNKLLEQARFSLAFCMSRLGMPAPPRTRP